MYLLVDWSLCKSMNGEPRELIGVAPFVSLKLENLDDTCRELMLMLHQKCFCLAHVAIKSKEPITWYLWLNKNIWITRNSTLPMPKTQSVLKAYKLMNYYGSKCLPWIYKIMVKISKAMWFVAIITK